MSDTAPQERKKPGRKSETLTEKLARLEREMQVARQAIAEAEQQRLATIGAALLAEAESDPAFMKTVRRVLRSRVTTRSGKALLSGLVDHSSSDDKEDT